jgi:hypothetical protein
MGHAQTQARLDGAQRDIGCSRNFAVRHVFEERLVHEAGLVGRQLVDGAFFRRSRILPCIQSASTGAADDGSCSVGGQIVDIQV